MKWGVVCAILFVVFLPLTHGTFSLTFSPETAFNTNEVTTFNVVNTNGNAVILTSIQCLGLHASTAKLVKVHYKTSAISSSQNMNSANGWVQVFSQTITSDSNEYFTMNIGSLEIPASSTYAIAVQNSGYWSTPSGIEVTLTTSGVSIKNGGSNSK